jgi:gamma-glutamyl-gamma-aminobutyrate hydrolase PuuD
MRPLIGITSYAEPVTWGVWTEEAAVIQLAYVRAVEKAGGRPLVVPPSDHGLEETLDVLDGVIFSGGGDLDPELYGADAHEATDTPRKERDAAELRLLQAAQSPIARPIVVDMMMSRERVLDGSARPSDAKNGERGVHLR